MKEHVEKSLVYRKKRSRKASSFGADITINSNKDNLVKGVFDNFGKKCVYITITVKPSDTTIDII